MRGVSFFTTVVVVALLAIADTAQALWSPEPVDLPDIQSAPATGQPLSGEPKVPMGFTPPVNFQDMEKDVGQQHDDPVARRLAAVEAEEAIEIPFISAKEAASMETFTRVNPVAAKPAAAADATDTSVPSPAAYWLLLGTLPFLFLTRRRYRARFG